MRGVRVSLLFISCLWLLPGSAAASGWLTPVSASDAGQNAEAPQVAVDADGDAVAVWRRSDGTNERVQAATRTPGGAWTTPITLSAAGQDAYDPQVAVRPNGDAVAVWRRSDGANQRVQAATRPAGGAWTTPGTLSDAGNDAYEPALAVGANGDATTVWGRHDGANARVQAATRPAGGAWTSPDTVSTAGQDAYPGQVGVDASGNATAVWYRSDGANMRVQAATRPAGGAWAAPDTLSASGQGADYPHVAVGANGDATAVWRRFDGSNQRVQAATRPAGGAWTTPRHPQRRRPARRSPAGRRRRERQRHRHLAPV
ncbi:hypothetical protein LRS13_11290 [Svornostia abyssi]|uniref:Uncharacterized protein n=1 Tax=Svornostia abyssi TaxID=2898438 RepID=A0ABY5PN46_9ACTN|nr:hypothetical protein LRS13_11290 [Parviterribacteraceae bacterium J379]